MNAQTIMICSGKGGTGKSTVSVLLGAQLGAWSRRVLLIELDSGLRSVDMIAGGIRQDGLRYRGCSVRSV